jgi:hypothetical protein
MTVHAPKTSTAASLRSKELPEEWQARTDLAAASDRPLVANDISIKRVEVPPDVIEATYMSYQPQVRRPFGVLDWPDLLRKLDHIGPGFRD